MKNPTITFLMAIVLFCTFYYGNVPFLRSIVGSEQIHEVNLPLLLSEMMAAFLVLAFSIVKQRFVSSLSCVFIALVVADMLMAYTGVVGNETSNLSGLADKKVSFGGSRFIYSAASVLLGLCLVDFSKNRSAQA